MSDNTGLPMVDNFREVQPLNGRKLFINEVDDSKSVYEIKE